MTASVDISGICFSWIVHAFVGMASITFSCSAGHADLLYGASAVTAQHEASHGPYVRRWRAAVRKPEPGWRREQTLVSEGGKAKPSVRAYGGQTEPRFDAMTAGVGRAFVAAAVSSDAALTTDKEWLAVDLAGRPVLDGTSITVTFHGDGRVSGNAGTNNYMGRYERTGPNGLRVSDLAATKKYMDFPPGRMRQETDYLDALRSIDRFTLEDDEFSLWTGSDRSIRYTLVH